MYMVMETYAVSLVFDKNMILYYTNGNRRNNIKIYRRYDPTDRAVVAFIIKTFQNDCALRCNASALPLQRIPIIHCRRSESLLLLFLL